MIAYLHGRIFEKHPNRIVVDVGGVGYDVLVPLSTFYGLGDAGSDIRLRIHTHVREDALLLYGFVTQLEQDLFERLISISGIGPKVDWPKIRHENRASRSWSRWARLVVRNRVASAGPNSEVTLKVFRDGKDQEMHARLAELPVDKNAAGGDDSQSGAGTQRGQLGISVAPLRPEDASELGIKGNTKGAVVTDVDPSGPASEAGIQKDDVILEVNHQAVTNGTEIREG